MLLSVRVPQTGRVALQVAVACEPMRPLRRADEISVIVHEIQVQAAGRYDEHVLSAEMRTSPAPRRGFSFARDASHPMEAK